MTDFNPDKLRERLDQLNDEQIATMEKLVEDLLSQMEDVRAAPKRAEPKASRKRVSSAA